MDILCIREESRIKGYYKNYNISELLDKIDIILTEYGFVGNEIKNDKKINSLYRIYKSLEGEIKVRFTKDNSRLIPLVLNNKEFKCPIYIERRGISKSIDEQLLKEFEKI